MNRPLRILHLEDDPRDAALARAALAAAGLPAEVTVAAGREDFLATLAQGRFDVILADYRLPACDGLAALADVRKVCPQLPLLILCGALDEDVAVAALRQGAADCVLKDQLYRLAPTLRRILREAEQERQLQARKLLYQTLAEKSLAGVYVLQDGRFRFLNGTAAAFFGYAWQELIDTKPDALVYPEDRETIGRWARQMLRGERAAPYEFRIVARDGRIRWIMETVSSIEYEGARAVLGNVMDVTDKRRQQELLAASESKYRDLVDNALVGIYQTNLAGDVHFINRAGAAFLGYDDPEAIRAVNAGKMYADPQDRDRFLARLRAENGAIANFETTFRTRTGEEMPVLMNAVCNGELISGMFMNITVRKQMEASLRESCQRLRRTLEESALALATAMEMRDPYTAGHQARVARISCAIAKELGFSEDRLEGIRVAGILHDIGKIRVPAEILNRPGRLSPLEFNMVKGHVKTGYDILKGIEFPWPVAEVVYQHHERLDGSGYPRGLRGGEILPEAKILAAADVIEAMSSFRPYRPEVGVEAALAEIRAGRKRLFDPEVVDACDRIHRAGGFKPAGRGI